MEKVGTYTVAIIFFIPLAFLFSLYNGWALSYLWSWFIVPFGIPAITAWHGAGLFIVKGLLFGKYQKENEESPWKKLGGQIVFAILAPLFALIFGYIIRFWFM